MTRPLRVVFATDGSSDAKIALEWMRVLPLPPSREVMVVTVVTPPRGRADARDAVIAEARRLADDTASALLTGRSVTGRVVEGDPREEIVTAAASWGADLLVLGARGLGAVKELLLGGVSLWVARHAPCPVLVCKGTPRPLRTITVGVDGSDAARHAAEWLGARPLPADAEVRLVGVLERAAQDVEAKRRDTLERALADAARALPGHRRVTSEIVSGAPADALVRTTARVAGDLVVVGARGAGALTRLLLGSVSEAVLRHTACPVLIVRKHPLS